MPSTLEARAAEVSKYGEALLRQTLVWWGVRPLAQKFLVAAAIVLVPAMALTGWWVSKGIITAVTENTANAAALYMESSVAPLIQELATSDQLTPQTRERLDRILADATIRERIVSMKIWAVDGTILYSTWPQMIGQKFPPSENFKKALSGGIGAEFDSVPHVEDHHERQAGKPLLEIYAPVRAYDSQRIIAISEFYGNAEKLQADIRQSKRVSMAVMAGVTSLMLAALFGIVRQGSHTIDEQRLQLTSRIAELKVLLDSNEELRARLLNSNVVIADINERILHRLGGDLHDGPAQLLTYALLRLGKLAPVIEKFGSAKDLEELTSMRQALQDTLREVRNLSEGLSLPELASLNLEQSIRKAIAGHELHTNTSVQTHFENLSAPAPHAVKACAFRFVQEGLANAFHHADARGQQVRAKTHNARLEITVSDQGPGIAGLNGGGKGLGLLGLRARVEAVGGEMKVHSRTGEGTSLSVSIDLDRSA